MDAPRHRIGRRVNEQQASCCGTSIRSAATRTSIRSATTRTSIRSATTRTSIRSAATPIPRAP
ncbi:MAG TPA: hypothetical protein VK987_00875, partial [Anaerolineae bacterium]|nr:hypothetical protein [Anaerolineae bacterium]